MTPEPTEPFPMFAKTHAIDLANPNQRRCSQLRFNSLACVLALCISSIARSEEKIDYANDVQPILSRHCVACHSSKLAEGGLNLEDHAAFSKGGDSGESFVAGNPDSSYLLTRVNGSEEPWMPPEDNAVGAERLTQAELQIIETWIRQGAEASSIASATMLELQPLPAQTRPTYDLEFAPDGSFLTYGFGSTAYVVPIDRTNISHTSSGVSIPLVAGDGQPTTHLDIVQSIAVSPDSQRIATGGFKQVKLWRQTRSVTEYLRDLIPHGDQFSLSPGGRHLAYQSGQNTFEVIDLERGVSQRYFKTHSRPIVAICWLDKENVVSCDDSGACFRTSIDGQQQALTATTNSVERILAADSSQGWVYIVFIDSSHHIHLARRSVAAPQNQSEWETVVVDVLPATTTKNPVTVVLAVSEQRQLAVASKHSVSVRNRDSWEVQTKFETQSPVSTLQWNSDGKLLAVGFPDRSPEVRDPASGDLKFRLDQDYAASQRLQYLTDQSAILGVRRKKVEDKIEPAKTLASKEAETVVKLTEERDKAIASRDKAATAFADLQTQIQELESLLADVPEKQPDSDAEDESKSSEQRKQRQQELAAKGKTLDSLEANLTKAEADVAERKQALASAREVAELTAARVPALEKELSGFAAEMTELESKVKMAEKHVSIGQETSSSTGARPLSFLFDETQVVVAQADRLSFFNLVDGSPSATVTLDDEQLLHLCQLQDPSVFLTFTDSGNAYQVAFSPAWELENIWGSIDENVFPDRITALDFSPDGHMLAIGSGSPSRSGDVYLVESGGDLPELIHAWQDLHSDQVLALRYSPDGRYLASGAADKICRVLDVASQQSFRKLEGHGHHILGIDWCWDAQTLATASADGTTKVWNVDDATQLKTITGLSGEITSVQYLGKTNTLSAVSTASNARTLDAASGKVLKNLGSSQKPLYAVTATTSPPMIAAAGQTGTVWIWHSESGKLEAQIKSPTLKEPLE